MVAVLANPKWSEDLTIKMIMEYEQRDYLWNPVSENYKNKKIREAGYVEILNVLNLADVTVKELKNKIKNIRSSYSVELKKIRAARKASAHAYRPSVTWFEHADRFLRAIVTPSSNAPQQDPVYRKVAIVENFFDIIYTVHVELEGKSGKHAGQKRTYRTITETYAFLPREAVTHFLTGCSECARRPRSVSPPLLPTPSPSPTLQPVYQPFNPAKIKRKRPPKEKNTFFEQSKEFMEKPLTRFEPELPKPFDYALRNRFTEPPFRELLTKTKPDIDINDDGEVLTKTNPDIDENSFIDVEEIRIEEPQESKLESEITRVAEVSEIKTELKKKYNPLDVENLTSKDPPKDKSPFRTKLMNFVAESTEISRCQKPWKPGDGLYYNEEIDFSVPITTTYLKHMRSLKLEEREQTNVKDNLTPESVDMNDDDYSGLGITKEAEKLKTMLMAWNYHGQPQGRNGDVTESGADSMADLWASYHTALGLGNKPTKPPTPLATGHSSPIHMGSATPGVEAASTHDETSSSDRTKDDDDGGASDDDSDDRVDQQHHDPERLKAFNMFVRLFVDENLDRIVPISKQPKEKIQAIIDSCTRQFPEFAERARKRIRTYLKSCRRNKKVRGDNGPSGNGTASVNAWDTTVRPTPAHLTSVQAEHILAQACENESLNAKRMRLGLDPVSQPMPTVATPMAIDTTASSAVASTFLSLYSGAMSNPSSTPVTSTSNSLLVTSGHSKVAPDTTRPSNSPNLENSLLNNNCLKIDNANGNTGSKTASPASSPAPLFRPTFPTFGTPQTFGRQSTNNNAASAALSSSALLSSLSALPSPGVGVNAAMAAYQSALLSAMTAQTHAFPNNMNNISAPTDLSVKNVSTSTPLHLNTNSHMTGNNTSSQPKSSLMSHKLSGAEVGAVRQLITGYRESAAFLIRSADELESLLLNQT